MTAALLMAACDAGEGGEPVDAGACSPHERSDAATDAHVQEEPDGGPPPFEPCDPADGGAETRLPADIQAVFDDRCVDCHGAKDPKGDVDLRAAFAYANLVCRRAYELDPPRNLVELDYATRSYLLNKLEGTHVDLGGHGYPMPMGEAAIEPDAIGRIAAWINAGAPAE
ncbi:MAG: hypothetical protein AABZ30_02440 [Myxococcota bacterium]